MRVTLNIDDDVLHLLRAYSKKRSVTMSTAASDLIRSGAQEPVRTRLVNGLHVVVLPEGSPKVTSAHVRRLLEDDLP